MRRGITWLNRAASLIMALVVLYLAAAFVAALMPANRDFVPPLDGIEVFVVSNGVHTDIVVPTQAGGADWLQTFRPEHFRDPAALGPFIGFGWGDRGFYLETPRWSDLTLGTTLHALFGGGPSVMHVSYEWEPDLEHGARSVRLTETQFEALVDLIHASFRLDADGGTVLIPGAGYGGSDAFYEARGSYSPFNTCNQWVADILRRIGVRAPLWAPFDRGILANL